MKLLWMDLETTGLDPARDRILEVAAFVADLGQPFDVAGESIATVLRATSFPEMVPTVRQMHTTNGLLVECAKSTVVVADVERALLEILSARTGDEDPDDRTTLAGSSVHYDLAFLRRHMPTLAAGLSHRVYDVSAVELFCRSLGMPKLTRAGVHRAVADVRESIAHGRACASWLETWRPDPSLRSGRQ